MIAGKALRLRRLTSRGRTVIVALEHGVHAGPLPGLESPTDIVKMCAQCGADGVLLTPGILERVAEHVEGLSVRPDHRMVAHTGFLITARRLADGTERFIKAKRGSKTEFTDEDVELWTPGAVGDRTASDKKLRKAAREAQSLAERSARRQPIE